MMLIPLNVDNPLITGDNSLELQLVKAEFSNHFKVKDLGEAEKFLFYELLVIGLSALCI